jgi:hypothetical protein
MLRLAALFSFFISVVYVASAAKFHGSRMYRGVDYSRNVVGVVPLNFLEDTDGKTAAKKPSAAPATKQTTAVPSAHAVDASGQAVEVDCYVCSGDCKNPDEDRKKIPCQMEGDTGAAGGSNEDECFEVFGNKGKKKIDCKVAGDESKGVGCYVHKRADGTTTELPIPCRRPGALDATETETCFTMGGIGPQKPGLDKGSKIPCSLAEEVAASCYDTKNGKIEKVSCSHEKAVDEGRDESQAKERACAVLTVKAPLGVVRKTADIWGIYTLQFMTYDRRPVYRQHTHICKRAELLKADAAAPKDINYGCIQKVKKDKHYLFYDRDQRMWKLGSSIAQYAVDVVASSEGATPDLVEAGAWKTATLDSGYSIVEGTAAGITVSCRDKIAHKPVTHGKTSHIITKRLDAKLGSKCVKWRKTGGCDPDGPREHEQDKGCSATIIADWSGYCECGSGLKHKVACGHEPFTCASACKISFPFVIAQSGERVWTNQFARNLLSQYGDWMTSATKNQWVIFDLGWVRQVRVINFKLWGSDASPKNVRMETSSHHLGPWSVAVTFKVPKKTSFTYKVPTEKSLSRYWRMYLVDNWGATWGIGLNEVQFTGPKTTKKVTDPCVLFKSRKECVEKSITKEQITRIEAKNRDFCGWCPDTKKCFSGNPQAPTSVACGAPFTWNGLAKSSSTALQTQCQAHKTCTACAKSLECGWCISTSACTQGTCSVFSDRQCSALGLTGAMSRALGVSQHMLIAAGIVIVVMVVPLVVLFRRRNTYWAKRRTLKDAGAQWDDEATSIIDMPDQEQEAIDNSYHNEGESTGLLR